MGICINEVSDKMRGWVIGNYFLQKNNNLWEVYKGTDLKTVIKTFKLKREAKKHICNME